MKNYSLNGIKRLNAAQRAAIAFDMQRHHDAVRRFAVLVAASAALGVVIGFVLPHVSQPVLVLTGGAASVGQAARWLRALPVAQPNSASGYDRDSFAFRSTDDDGNGCKIADAEKERTSPNAHFGGAVVGELIVHKFFIDIPSHKPGKEHASKREQNVARHKVEQFEKRFAENGKVAEHAKRQRTQCAEGDADAGV